MVEPDGALTLVLALAAGVLSQSIARHLRVPGIVVLLLVGVALGPDGIGWVHPRSLGSGFFSIVDLAVAIILFEGGLNLRISLLRREQAAIRRLVTWGALATLAGAAICVFWILDWDWQRSLLFGSLVVVTGPTVIGPLVSELRLRTRVATVLEAEGVLIDPIGAILAVLVLELVIAPESAAAGAVELVLRIGFGTVTGIVVGLALARVLRVHNLVPEGHQNVLVLACVLLLSALCDHVVPHSGILAVTLAGVAVGNTRTLVDRDLREFKDQLTVMLIGLLFVMLAADVRFADVAALGWTGVAVVGLLILVVRPLVVAMATARSELEWKERMFVGWVAPRGIVAAAVASLVAGAMEESGLEGGPSLRALVFLTITGTVLQAGLTAGLVGRWLGVRLPGRDGVAILGVHGLGILLAERLRKWDTRVVFIDANPQNCRRAEESGFPVIFGNALEERILRRARMDTIETAVALTPNQTVNGVFADRARSLFDVPRGYVAVEQLDSGLVAEMVEKQVAQVAFDGVHDVERWDVRLRHGGVESALFRFVGAPEAEGAEGAEGRPDPLPPIGEKLVLLAYLRGGKARPVSVDYQPREGDVVAVALHIPDMDDALAAVTARGYERVPDPEPGEDAEEEGSLGTATPSSAATA